MFIENTSPQPITMSAKEVARARKTTKQLQETSAAGFKTKEITIGPVFANLMGFVWGLLMFIPVFILYYNKFNYIIEPNVMEYMSAIAYLAYLIAIPIHEGIHGICMYLFNGHKRDAIEFGINSSMPYCTCQAPIKKWPYVVVLIMPTIILGIAFSLLTLHLGSAIWLFFTFATFAGAGGDFTIVSKLIFCKEKELTVIDHPYKCGYLMLHKDEAEDETDRIINELNNIQEKKTDPAEKKKTIKVVAIIFAIVIACAAIGGIVIGLLADCPQYNDDQIIVSTESDVNT